jgi:23S rRNA-/tRNA-specific pseudouridylate synthase
MAALEKKPSHIKMPDTGPENNGPAPNRNFYRIKDYLATDGKKTFCTGENEKGKITDTLFIKLKETENADIYSVFIFTGRRHQIRFHAAHYLSPVVGDILYGSEVRMPPDEIALMCRGYNIPWRKEQLKVRLPEKFIDEFFKKRIPKSKTD